jgi:hypothetical protein
MKYCIHLKGHLFIKTPLRKAPIGMDNDCSLPINMSMNKDTESLSPYSLVVYFHSQHVRHCPRHPKSNLAKSSRTQVLE